MCHAQYMAFGTPFDLTEPRSFFLEPALPKHRQYEALRAYFAHGPARRRCARLLAGPTPLLHRVRRPVPVLARIGPPARRDLGRGRSPARLQDDSPSPCLARLPGPQALVARTQKPGYALGGR